MEHVRGGTCSRPPWASAHRNQFIVSYLSGFVNTNFSDFSAFSDAFLRFFTAVPASPAKCESAAPKSGADVPVPSLAAGQCKVVRSVRFRLRLCGKWGSRCVSAVPSALTQPMVTLTAKASALAPAATSRDHFRSKRQFAAWMAVSIRRYSALSRSHSFRSARTSTVLRIRISLLE